MLIKCSTCGKEIPSNATACPHCGEPSLLEIGRRYRSLEENDLFFKVAMGLILFVVIVAILWAVLSNNLR